MTRNQIAYAEVREKHRANTAAETENQRHNRAQESIGSGNISLGYSQLGENIRHNLAGEELNFQNYLLAKELNPAKIALTSAQAESEPLKAASSVAQSRAAQFSASAAMRQAAAREAQNQLEAKKYQDIRVPTIIDAYLQPVKSTSEAARGILDTLVRSNNLALQMMGGN